MSSISLPGLNGSNPLGFLAALGVLRVVPGVKLGFSNDGTFQAYLDGLEITQKKLAQLITVDAETAADESAPWRFTYTKGATKKQGPQKVADLKPPPIEFKAFLESCVESWLVGDAEAAGYAAAYATDVAVDGKGNTKPTAFHFTAANQTFLGAVEGIRSSIDQEWVEASLFVGHGSRPGSNLRWDPSAERNWALMANNPNDDGTRVDAPLEWLAFRGLPLLPSFPRSSKIITTNVTGRGDDMTFTWPLWSLPISLATARSVMQVDWTRVANECEARGIFAICSSAIKRTSQGFGNFSPSSIRA